MINQLRYLLLLAIKAVSRIFYRFEVTWVTDVA